jgi:hypothetical protein
MNEYVKQLTKLARTYRAAEEAIVTAYFKKSRRKTDHLDWLRAQAFKEYSAIKPILTALAKLYPEIDRGIDRHDFEELTEKIGDETRHARLIMDLLEEITGKKVTLADLPWLPEDRKLARIRARYSKSYATLLHGSGVIKTEEIKRKDEELERAAITLTEGGGGALYGVCRRLQKNGIEAKIAAVFDQIHRDELNHKNSGQRALANIIKTKAAFERAARIVCEVSRQRLRMRNEQFGFPMTDRAIKDLDEQVKRSVFAS